MNESHDLSTLLAAAQQSLRPTDAERERVRAAVLQVIDEPVLEADELDCGFVQGPPTEPTPHELASAPIDIGVEPPRVRRAGRGWLLMTAAAAALLLVVAVSRLVATDDPSLVDTGELADASDSVDLPATDLPEPAPGRSSEPAESTGSTQLPVDAEPATEITLQGSEQAVIEAGRYTVSLGGHRLTFDLYDERIVAHLGPNTVVFESTRPGSAGSQPRLTIAIAPADFGDGGAEAWLERQSVPYAVNRALIGSHAADDFEIDLDSPHCEPATPCQQLPLSVDDDDAVWLVDGQNRLLVYQLDRGGSLAILDTSGGNRSGVRQRAYNTLVSSVILD